MSFIIQVRQLSLFYPPPRSFSFSYSSVKRAAATCWSSSMSSTTWASRWRCSAWAASSPSRTSRARRCTCPSACWSGSHSSRWSSPWSGTSSPPCSTCRSSTRSPWCSCRAARCRRTAPCSCTMRRLRHCGVCFQVLPEHWVLLDWFLPDFGRSGGGGGAPRTPMSAPSVKLLFSDVYFLLVLHITIDQAPWDPEV